MKWTPINNPITWLLAALLGLVLGLLLLNLIARGKVESGMPAHGLDKLVAGSDSVTVVPAPTAYSAGGFKRWLHGSLYRDAWASPVTVPTLRLAASPFGPLRPDDRGGGFQTLSLDLLDTAGTVYTLRSVCKNPERLVKPWMQTLRIDNIVVDGIAAGHPYGASAARALSDALNIPHFEPQLYFVPEQAALDSFNADFGGRLFWLEYEPEDKGGAWTGLPNFEKWEDSEDLLETLSGPDAPVIDTTELLRARLFDLWVGDWDRHRKQWGWAVYRDADGRRRARAFPNDRDNIFYGLNGVLPQIISRFERRLQPFGPEVRDMDGLTQNSVNFDLPFLRDIPRELFLREATRLQSDIAALNLASILEEAWPREAYELDGDRIAASLAQRAQDLPGYAQEFCDVMHERGELQEVLEEEDAAD